jgi:hypothetical protein
VHFFTFFDLAILPLYAAVSDTTILTIMTRIEHWAISVLNSPGCEISSSVIRLFARSGVCIAHLLSGEVLAANTLLPALYESGLRIR